MLMGNNIETPLLPAQENILPLLQELRSQLANITPSILDLKSVLHFGIAASCHDIWVYDIYARPSTPSFKLSGGKEEGETVV